ncbi:dehydrogenase/reductase SDR family member 11-like [Vespula squamosa]|uniref:Dehydrogenase/reductase SDR family member 11-like n=1 Tax=Vespula squamosa TaxID=30214 RepID=A0ABD2ACP9_VESSQ
MERWSGKTALVTGASAGIGAKIAEELAKHGLKVVAIARRLNKLEELKTKVEEKKLPGKIYPMKCDVSKEEEILNVFKWIKEKLGEVNVLINNAGIIVNEKIIDGSTENFRNIMDVNVIALAICTREAVRLMSKSKMQGHIININSVSGHDARSIKMPFSLYPSSKYAITGMSESVRNEIMNDGLDIKVTSISPGIVKTDMVKNFNLSQDVVNKLLMLSDEEVAEGVIYALSRSPNVEVNELIIAPLHQSLP